MVCLLHHLLQSNNSTKTRAMYVEQLASHGIAAVEDEVVASAYVTAKFMLEAGFAPGDKVYVVGEHGLHSELRSVGLQTLGEEDDGKHAKLSAFRKDTLDQSVKCVVVGLDSKFSYYKLAMAASYLRYVPGCRFIATNACVPCWRSVCVGVAPIGDEIGTFLENFVDFTPSYGCFGAVLR